MPITVQCGGCHKKYKVADKLAGKRMRCKGCNAIMLVPADQAADEPDLSIVEPEPFSLNRAIADAHRQANGGRGRIAHRGDDDEASHSHLGDSNVFEHTDDGDDDGDRSIASPAYVANPPFRFSGSRELDTALPYVLAALSMGWLVFDSIRAGNAHGHAWVPHVRWIAYVLLYVAIVYPLVSKGVSAAGEKLRFGKPAQSPLKVFGAFAFPYTLGVVLAIYGGNLLSFVMGAAVGLVVGLAAFWFLFRLRPHQAVPAMARAGGFFAVGSVIAIGLLVAANAVTLTMLNGYKTAHHFSESPVAPFLAWNPVKPEVEKPQKGGSPVELASGGTTENSNQVAPTTSTQPTTDPSAVAGAAATTTQPATVVAVVDGQRLTPPAGENPGADAVPTASVEGGTPTKPMVAVNVPPVPVPDVPTPPTPPTPPETTPDAPKVLPALADTAGAALAGPAEEAAAVGEFEELVIPSSPGGVALLVRSRTSKPDADDVETWSLAGKPERRATILPQRPAGSTVTYVAGPKGIFVAWMVDFPRKELKVRSVTNEKFLREIPLDTDRFGEPTLLGFGMNDQIVVFWEHGTECGVQTFNIMNGNVVRAVDVHNFAKGQGENIALSPDGKYVAAAVEFNQMPALQIVELFGTRSDPRRIPLPDLQHKPLNLSGMSFSSDGSKVALMYEEGNNTMLLGCRTQGGAGQVGVVYTRQLYFSPLLSDHPAIGEYKGAVIDWVHNDAHWMLYGRVVVETERAAVVGKIGVPGVRSHEMVDRDTIAFVVPGSVEGKSKVVMGKLAGGKAAAAGPASKPSATSAATH